MKIEGIIISWFDEKGYGFVQPSSGGKQVFIHISSFRKRRRTPEINELVSYELSRDKHGRACGVNAAFVGNSFQGKLVDVYKVISVIAATIFLAFIAIMVVAKKLPSFILVFYFIASVLSFILYARDKSAAKKGAWRIQESTLHFLSIIGGWPGALIAQQELRHKSKKRPFRIVFWITVIINLSVLWFVFYPADLAILVAYLLSQIGFLSSIK